MDSQIPTHNQFDDFYIWFSADKKEEYYSTPLYFYKSTYTFEYTKNSEDTINTFTQFGGTRYIKWKENEGTDRGLKAPATIFFPFVEKLGLLLLRFLNADLSSFDTAYKDFFYAYGFEILKDLDEFYKFDLLASYENDENYLKAMNKIYHDLKDNLIYLQENLIDAVNYIYNIDDIEELRPYTHSERYAVYLIKRKGKLYSYKKNDTVIADSYSNKYNELFDVSEYELLEKLKNKTTIVSMVNTHKSNDLSSICYAILEELSKINNYPIKKCQNCGMYFIPNSRLDEIYCDYPKPDGKTCREKGATLSYNKRLQEKTPYSEYRKLYVQKFTFMNKNKGNKQIKKEFDTWKKQAKEQITKLKHGELTDDDVYKWLEKNK